jgi:hypothetical protein
MTADVTLSLSADEALVLYEFLVRGACRDLPKHPAEDRVLWDLECLLEARLDCVLLPDYAELVERAREQLGERPS